jgi:hypothetical protein
MGLGDIQKSPQELCIPTLTTLFIVGADEHASMENDFA